MKLVTVRRKKTWPFTLASVYPTLSVLSVRPFLTWTIYASLCTLCVYVYYLRQTKFAFTLASVCPFSTVLFFTALSPWDKLWFWLCTLASLTSSQRPLFCVYYLRETKFAFTLASVYPISSVLSLPTLFLHAWVFVCACVFSLALFHLFSPLRVLSPPSGLPRMVPHFWLDLRWKSYLAWFTLILGGRIALKFILSGIPGSKTSGHSC